MHKITPIEWITLAFMAIGVTVIAGLLYPMPAHAAGRSADPSVQIYIEHGDQILGTCSGAVVNTTFGRGVLTAGHCVEGSTYEMVDEFGQKTKIAPVYVDHIHDVAFMAIMDQSYDSGAYDLSCHATLTPGESIHITGYPLDYGRLSVDGKIISPERDIAWWPVAAFADILSGAGNSGSAVRDDSGHVVGILTGGRGEFGDLAIIVPVSVFCNPGLAN